MSVTALARHPSMMEPLLPSDRSGALSALAAELIRKSSALSGRLHPLTRATLADHLARMNSYYSNLIEGHHTHPLAIERALNADYSRDPAKRALQLESKAHVEVQQLLERRAATEPDFDPCSPDAIAWIHHELYARMPAEFRVVRGGGREVAVEPGAPRGVDVQVGAHVAPSSDALPAFLARFREVYSGRLPPLERIVAVAAAHHRLLWIHPFADGNGRVARLFTHVGLARALGENRPLWAISRGFARRKADYLAALASADQPRRGDLDGRGNLSDEALRGFCDFFLRVAIDQVEFMSAQLELDELDRRLGAFVELRHARREMKLEAALLLREALLRGEFPRGEAARISGLPERTARIVVRQLTDERLLTSETPKGPLRLGLPARAVGYWFPRLYPEGVEEGLRAGRE